MFSSSYFLVDMIGLATALAILCGDVFRSRFTAAYTKYFRILLLCLCLLFVMDALSEAFDGREGSGMTTVLYLVDTVYYGLQITYCWVWLLFTVCWLNGVNKFSRSTWALLAVPFAAEILLVLTNPYTGWVFTLDAANEYHRGSAYLPNLLPYVFYIGATLSLGIYSYFHAADENARRRSAMLCTYLFLPVCGALVEAVHSGTAWTWPFAVLSLLLIYMNIQQEHITDEKLRAAALETKLTESRTAIMLSQIQPHFLYNALAAIKQLCDEDPQAAKHATSEFADFLRGNMGSLTQTRPISFDMELAHTKNYLTLEQYRFQDRLCIVYDIGPTLFRLPTLTLQPIVENAVRYGVTKRERGGTVTIMTREEPDCYRVIVKDDGVGFDPYATKEDGRTHVGIDNVKDRLAKMVGGTLEIASVPGSGTTATITIPKEGTP
ncbi:MAG: histidine kinase [Eubacteriales bacterium]|nr:histidine kinase [Eubacteriales bacterium]